MRPETFAGPIDRNDSPENVPPSCLGPGFSLDLPPGFPLSADFCSAFSAVLAAAFPDFSDDFSDDFSPVLAGAFAVGFVAVESDFCAGAAAAVIATAAARETAANVRIERFIGVRS